MQSGAVRYMLEDSHDEHANARVLADIPPLAPLDPPNPSAHARGKGGKMHTKEEKKEDARSARLLIDSENLF